MDKFQEKKLNLIVTSLLSRLTDFQLQTSDDDLFSELEEIRDAIVSAQENIKKNLNVKMKKKLDKSQLSLGV